MHSESTQIALRCTQMHSDALRCTRMLQSCAHLLLGKARVDDIHDPVDGEGGLGDVRREDDLTPGRPSRLTRRRRRVEDGALTIHRQSRVEREYDDVGNLWERGGAP